MRNSIWVQFKFSLAGENTSQGAAGRGRCLTGHGLDK